MSDSSKNRVSSVSPYTHASKTSFRLAKVVSCIANQRGQKGRKERPRSSLQSFHQKKRPTRLYSWILSFRQRIQSPPSLPLNICFLIETPFSFFSSLAPHSCGIACIYLPQRKIEQPVKNNHTEGGPYPYPNPTPPIPPPNRLSKSSSNS